MAIDICKFGTPVGDSRRLELGEMYTTADYYSLCKACATAYCGLHSLTSFSMQRSLHYLHAIYLTAKPHLLKPQTGESVA